MPKGYFNDLKYNLLDKGVSVSSASGKLFHPKPVFEWNTKIQFENIEELYSKEVREKKFKEAEDLIKFIKEQIDVYTGCV